VKADPRASMGRRAPALAVAALLLLGNVACRRDVEVARALAVEGTAERDHAGDVQAVTSGVTFTVGDTLRTGGASQVRLGLMAGGVIRVGERARLRFQSGATIGREAPEIAVELGSAEVEETTSEMAIVTALGPARVARGARVRVRADGQTASLEVVVGRAVVLEAGHEVSIEAGQGVRIKIGTPEIQRFALKVGEAIVEERPPRTGDGDGGGTDRADSEAASAGHLGRGSRPAEQAAGGGAGPARTLAQPSGDGPSSAGAGPGGRADLTLAAGESATVHVGRPPASVRLRFDGICPGDSVVELGGGPGHPLTRIAGSGSAVLHLAAGTRSYRVRCGNDGAREAPRAAGTLTVRRDTGYVPLTRRAPVNVIDADGRKYTVLFQTRLPQLTLAWPGAPAAREPVELHVESSTGERVVAASPSHPLPAGTVQEGTYTLWYRTSDGTQSPKTTLSVRFDNAAPTAQFFRAPAVEEERAPGAIPVDGVTVEGAKVTVGGEPLAIDAHGRFRGEAKPLEGDDAVAVRLEHPRLGIHYYVRRPAEVR